MTTHDLKNEICCVACFCHRLSKSAPEIIDTMKEAYKEDCSGESTIFRRHKAFSEGRESTELIPPPNRPVSASNEVNVIRHRSLWEYYILVQVR